MTAPLLRRTATCLRSRAEAVTADRWDGVGLWRLAAPDVLAELWAGVLDDVADVVDEAMARLRRDPAVERSDARCPHDRLSATESAERPSSRVPGRSQARTGDLSPDSDTDHEHPRRAA